LSGNVPSPIDHVQEPVYGSYADDQFYKGAQVMPEGQHYLLRQSIKDTERRYIFV